MRDFTATVRATSKAMCKDQDTTEARKIFTSLIKAHRTLDAKIDRGVLDH